jgi:hypothetical protein
MTASLRDLREIAHGMTGLITPDKENGTPVPRFPEVHFNDARVTFTIGELAAFDSGASRQDATCDSQGCRTVTSNSGGGKPGRLIEAFLAVGDA